MLVLFSIPMKNGVSVRYKLLGQLICRPLSLFGNDG